MHFLFDFFTGTFFSSLSLLKEDSHPVFPFSFSQGLKPMDSNGLADPYVKLHLLPGASKVRLCQVWLLGMEQRFLKPPSDQIFPVDFSARCCFPLGVSPNPDALPDLRNSSSCRQEFVQGWRETPEEALLLMHHKTSAQKSNYGQGWNYPFAWKLQHVLGAVGREPWGKLWLHHGNSWKSPSPAQLS